MIQEKDLLELKAKIAEAKNKLAELKGQKNALLMQLEKEWGCTSIKEARIKIEEMTAEIIYLDGEIQAGLAELNAKYPE